MLLDLTLNELKTYITSLGFPAFRAGQVYDAMIQGKKLEEVSNLPKDLLSALEKDYPHFEIAKKLESKDGTIKYAFKMFDGEIIESGTHSELLAKDGFYANLYNSQFKNGTEL